MPTPSNVVPYAHRSAALAARIAAAAALLPPHHLELVARIAEALARPIAARRLPAA